MSKKAIVTIDQNRHAKKIATKNMEEAIQGVLEKAGLYGEFKVSRGKPITGSEKVDAVKVSGNLDPKSMTIVLKVQADGRGSRHECILRIPSRYKNEAGEFYRKLCEATAKGRDPQQQVPGVKPEKNQGDGKSEPARESPVKDRRHSPAACVLREDGLLPIAMCELSVSLQGGVSRQIALEAIAKLGMSFSEKGALEYFLKEGLLSEERVSSHNRIIRLTEKGNELVTNANCGQNVPPPEQIAEPEQSLPAEPVLPLEPALPEQAEPTGRQDDDVADILEKLDGIVEILTEKEKRNVICIERLKVLDEEELRLSDALVALEEERKLLVQEMEEFSRSHAKLQRIKDALGKI